MPPRQVAEQLPCRLGGRLRRVHVKAAMPAGGWIAKVSITGPSARSGASSSAASPSARRHGLDDHEGVAAQRLGDLGSGGTFISPRRPR